MEKLKLTYKSAITSFTEVNSSFDSGVLRVCYTGDNRNGSSISRETMERCIHTIFNCPIVCNYDRETDSIGEHDMDIVMKEGKPVLINETQPIGVVPTGANWWFELDDDHEYLCVEVLVWKRQEAYAHIKENGITDESMEIAVTGYHRGENGIMVIDEFEFNAFCLLESAEPCYEGASLSLFTVSDAFKDMIEDLKNVSASISKVDMEITRKEEQNLEEKNKILAEFGLTAEQLGIEDLDSCTAEDLTAKCKEFSLTAGQLEDEIFKALSAVTYTDEWGTRSRYFYIDRDEATSTIFAIDAQEGWDLYGLSYSMNGDKVVIDFENPVRKKVSYVDFDEGETQEVFAMFATELLDIGVAMQSKTEEDLGLKYAEEIRTLEASAEESASKISELTAEVEELRQFKVSTLAEQREEEIEAVFAQFEDLSGIEAFESLREDFGEMSAEEIEDKCFSIRGRNMQFSHKKQQKNSARIPAKLPKAEDEPYGGVFEKYPPHK